MNAAIVRPGRNSHSLGRILPFVVYIGLLAATPYLREALPAGWDGRWLYAVQIAAVVLALAWFARGYEELRGFTLGWRDGLEALAVGVVVFVLWINLDFPWAMQGEPGAGFDPRTAAGDIDWTLAVLRILGAAAVVPIMEELFWRSFILRFIDKPDFMELPPASASWRALAISSVLFAVEHFQWLAGLIAGLAYGALYMRSQTLWSPILAHAVTNLLLGLWVVATGAWSFW
ncbi:MAG: CAAX prenyl protease-related protein [Sulfuritalea sp.]|nr:CAAX prenyl protease-related protein [Sulfuritalea sp.]